MKVCSDNVSLNLSVIGSKIRTDKDCLENSGRIFFSFFFLSSSISLVVLTKEELVSEGEIGKGMWV